MCFEHVDVAICAPMRPPALTFTCGKIHLVARNRQVCAKALGRCSCFFGTCGTIEKVASADTLDLAEITKVRCVGCTAREDQVGERRHGQELIDSPLLVRNPCASAAALERFLESIKEIWGGSHACPFHANDASQSDQATASGSEDGRISPSTPSPIKAVPIPTIRVTPIHKPTPAPQRPTTPEDADSGIKLNMGLTTSRWANAPATAMTVQARRATSPTMPRSKRVDTKKKSLLGDAKKFLDRE
ncbi:hypothetical protein PT974_10885 [Cladobotryum mycophilum]|uniref:Uncharacterized protein n=1 Tax=Cladobotryum mycophilum TaxID=491253 RepID=A0ABR0SB28_9HYPO